MAANSEVSGYCEKEQNVALKELGEQLATKIFGELSQVLAETLSRLRQAGRRHFFTLPNCWELFGADFLLEAVTARPVLLEINPSPSLAMYSSDLASLIGDDPLNERLLAYCFCKGGLTPYAVDASGFDVKDNAASYPPWIPAMVITGLESRACFRIIMGSISAQLLRAMLASWTGAVKARPWLSRTVFVSAGRRRSFASPSWATVDPETMSASTPAEGLNLCGGNWTTSKYSQEIVDPMNGDVFLKVPNTGMEEIEPFVQRMASVPRSGLHNPFKNPERYVMLGEVCGAAAREMFKPEVSDFFCRLIQRVAPKSYAQAGGEIKAVRTWLQDYSGNNVRMLAESTGLPGDHLGQTTVGYRMPFGGVSVITPFNFPLEICSLQTLSAVFMGNQCTTKVDWKVAIVMEQFLRMLHACGLPKTDVDYIYCDGPVFNEILLRGDAKMTLFTGSQRVADKLAVDLKGKVKLEDAGFDWKILGPDVMDVDYVAWQADHDAYGFSGQKCSAQSMLFMHENWTKPEVDIVGRLGKLAGQRSLENLTNCPVLTWPTEKFLEHMNRCLSIPGAKLAFGGKPLTGHSIPPQHFGLKLGEL
eukprot:symbB.v1.2.021531.t1/scaffold1865.1/size98072/8